MKPIENPPAGSGKRRLAALCATRSGRFALALLALFLLLLGTGLYLLRPTAAAQVEIWSEGEKIATFSLYDDQTFTVETAAGSNTISISGGKIAVLEASCPDGYCIRRGWCSGGSPIICLPNRLEIRFLAAGLDGVTG
ncbi:MAG: NusG domain II-containing protein [Firmicutes bacterium]|nr:NusG domain II-containing protein [Bacillota bacterium]